MGRITIFVARSESARSLEEVALEVFASFGVAGHQERLSSNYPPDDHYFIGCFAGGTVKVFDLEDVKPGYPYCVSLESSSELRPVPDASTLATSLVVRGLRAFVPEGRWTKSDWDGAGTEYAV